MSLGEFLADRAGRVAARLLAAGAAALFLRATGTQAGVLLLLAAVFLPLFAAAQLLDFFRQRARLRELEAVLDGLDQEYLFAECAPPPRGLFERRLFDLTRRAGRAMTGAVSDARAAQREYRDYVESWVHEIKSPITAAGLICRNLDGGTRRRLEPELARIEAHVERALFYARAESPEKDLLIRRVPLSELADRAIDQHRALLRQGGVRIETENLGQAVYTDGKWAVFLLGQLLQNAVRYRGDDPVIRLSAERRGERVRLTVADNGAGIPAHELPRVFDRGFTGSNGRARGGSTGMGLYLCRKLADRLEIELSAASEEGRGTAVTLTFPGNGNPAPESEGVTLGSGNLTKL